MLPNECVTSDYWIEMNVPVQSPSILVKELESLDGLSTEVGLQEKSMCSLEI